MGRGGIDKHNAAVGPGARPRGDCANGARRHGAHDLNRTHPAELDRATRLLRHGPLIASADVPDLCDTMEALGKAVGLPGPWRLLRTDEGDLNLCYCAWLNKRMPFELNEITWVGINVVDFAVSWDSGAKLEDELAALAAQFGGRPWRPSEQADWPFDDVD